MDGVAYNCAFYTVPYPMAHSTGLPGCCLGLWDCRLSNEPDRLNLASRPDNEPNLTASDPALQLVAEAVSLPFQIRLDLINNEAH